MTVIRIRKHQRAARAALELHDAAAERIREQTEPLIGYYKAYANSEEDSSPQYVTINGIGTMDSIRDNIFSALGVA